MTAAVITAALFFCNITPLKNAAKDSLPCPDNTNKFILFWVKSRRWQAPGAVKKKEKNRKKIRKKSEKKIEKIVPVPIYVFVDSEQKAEFKAKIKPCSHQLNCMKFLL